MYKLCKAFEEMLNAWIFKLFGSRLFENKYLPKKRVDGEL